MVAMNITIPKKIMKNDDLVILPRREYENLLRAKKSEEVVIKRSPSFKIKKGQEKFYKQVDFLILDIRYHSLHAKKYSGEENIWQGRVDKNVRFYFQIENDFYVLVDI